MSDGQELKIIYTNNISITATLIERKGWLPHVFVQIENKTPDRMLVDPSNWSLNIVTPKPKALVAKVPEELARSLEKRGAWAAALGNVGAAFATTQSTATVTNSDGKTATATVTAPDRAAQARAAANGAAQQAEMGSVADYVRSSSLKPNTVFPNAEVSGIVWFDHKKYKEVVLTIVVGGITYEFPFVKK